MKINVDNITIPNPSQNIDEEQIQGLAESIKELGLSHPIIVRPGEENAPPEEYYILVSGEKRLLAHRRLMWGTIDAEVRKIDETRGKEIRLHENLKRKNLAWYEEAILVEELHRLRQQEHGVPVRSGRPKLSPGRHPIHAEPVGWTIKDTAAELQKGVGSLSEDLTLARALQQDPTLSKVKDKKTAIRLVRVAAQRRQEELNAKGPSKIEANEVYFGDSASILKQLPDGCIDSCITDPPWIKFFDSDLRIDERTLPVFKEIYRVLRADSFLYLFCGLDDYDYYCGHDAPNPKDPSGTKLHTQGELERVGFSVSSTPIIWQKINSLSRRGVRPWEYDRDFEFIIVAAKGSPTLCTSRRLSGIKPYKIVHPVRMLHPNEKPVDLIEDIITDCSYEGEIVLDPFAGSGVLGSACKKSRRKYILIERDRPTYEKIVNRMEKT